MSRERSPSPRRDVDMEMGDSKANAKVVVVTNLTRSVVEAHLKTVFGFYGEITKIDLPLFGKSGQNRGKAALEYADTTSAHKAVSHMNGGQLDGATLKVELSDLPIRKRSRTPPPRAPRNGRGRGRSLSRTPISRSPSRSRSRTRSRTRSRSPPYRRGGGGYGGRGDSFRGGGGGYGRRGGGPPLRDRDRVYRAGANRSRSRSPIRRGAYIPVARRRSPSYTRGGLGRGRRASRSRSHSVRSSRSRTRSYSLSRSRSRSRSRSYSYSRSRSRSRSVSRGRGKSRSSSRDDIRDSRSRSPKAT